MRHLSAERIWSSEEQITRRRMPTRQTARLLHLLRRRFRMERIAGILKSTISSLRRTLQPLQVSGKNSSRFKKTTRQASNEMGDASAHDAVVTVVPAQPIYANLIQFPREIIATRRIRPRIAGIEAGSENELSNQLSIFEVDPATVSTEAAAPGTGVAGRSWAGPEWSDIQLDAQPDMDAQMDAEAAAAAPKLDLAPFGLRLMAAVVDTALIAAFVCADAAMVAAHMKQPPTIKAAELGAVVAMIAAGALYHWLFLTLGEATPGMRYARISLCTFDDEVPSRDQIRRRLGAMVLSLLPVGLGVAWAIFDDDRLTWHDRLSRTYQRRY